MELVDLYPTLADLCGLITPRGQELAGVSLRPLLDDPSLLGKSAAFTQFRRGDVMARTVCTERWRYTEWDEGRKGVELYDHWSDKQEYHNLASLPEQSAVCRQLRALLRAETEVLLVNVKPFHEKDYAGYSTAYQEKLKGKKFEADDPAILILGETYPLTLTEFKGWLEKKRRQLDKAGKEKVESSLTLFAHGDLPYDIVYKMLCLCKEFKFKNTRVQVKIKIK